MRALVTGGGGFVGAALSKALLSRGHEVRVLDSFATGFRHRVPEGAEVVEADLRDADAVLEACRGIDVVFHQGALRSVPKSLDLPRLVTESNVLGTLNVLEGARLKGCERVVYASSSSVVGDWPGVQHEDLLPRPVSPYAASKLAGEYYCRTWTAAWGLATISLRYFNVFGPGQTLESRYALVFPAFVSALAQGRPPVVYGDGEQRRDFTFVDDVVDANVAAATVDRAVLLEEGGPVVNVGSGEPRTVNEVLRAVSDAMGIWIDPEYRPPRPGDVRSTHADRRRARDLLGWEPRTPWEDAVARTVRSLSEMPVLG